MVPGSVADVSGSGALKFTAAFGCMRVLAEAFSCIPFFEYKKIDDKNREKTDETGWYDILHNRPNDEMSAFNWTEAGVYSVNLGGNFICLRDSTLYREPLGLTPVENDRVLIARDKATNRLVYEVRRSGETKTDKYDRGQIFHVPGPSLNGIEGMSPIRYAASAIQLGMTLEMVGNKMFRNGTFPTGVFKHPGELSDPAYNRLVDQIEKKWGGTGNFGRPILAEDGTEFIPLKLSFVDFQIADLKRLSNEDMCRIYRVQPHLIQDLARSTNNNIEHQSLEFVMYTMLPWARRWEQCINCQLLIREQRRAGYYFEGNLAALLRGDQKSQAEAFALGILNGWLSPNDVRRLLNLNAIPGGDVYLQQANMVPLGTKPETKPDAKLMDEINRLIESRA